MFPSLRFAIRALTKSPGFTAVAVLTLALGIGVNTAMFSLVDTLLFKTAPYPDAARLMRVYRTSPQSRTWPHAAPELTDLRAQAAAFESLTWFEWESSSLAEPGQPAERVPGLLVASGFFETLGIAPALGRGFRADEFIPGQNDAIVLSHGLWQDRFGGDPAIVGRTIRINGASVRVIGVMPDGFDYPMLWGRVLAWRPLALSPEQLQDRGKHWLNAIGRLKHDVSLTQAQAELDGLSARWAEEFPDTNAGGGLRLLPLHESALDTVGRNVSMLAFGLAGFVLLIACANLANLQLARTTARARDLAIRGALGASRARLVGELLSGSLVLSLAGAAVGWIFAEWVIAAISSRILLGEQSGLNVALDWRVLAFTLGASLATTLLFGLLPAWTAAQTDINATLKHQARGTIGDRSHHRLRHALIVAEVALALALLTGAGFFVRGLQRYGSRDVGWSRDHVLIATLSLPAAKYNHDEIWRAFYHDAVERLRALPGVEHAALTSSLPIVAYNTSRDFVPEGRPHPAPDETPLAYQVSVTPDFFSVLNIRLVQGRLFSNEIAAAGPSVAVVNETLARQFWPGENPIGKRIGGADLNNTEWSEVIGVVADVSFPGDLALPDTRLQVYQLLAQEPRNYLWIVLRTHGDPAALATSVREAIAAIDPDLPAFHIRPATVALDRLSRNFQLTNQLLVGFSVLGLLLAALGVYGVISNLVAQRTAEFGVRLALGARTRDVLALVLGSGLRLAVLGVAVGLVASLVLLRLFSALIPAFPGEDWLLLAFTVVLLLSATLIASWLPARRATRVDPMVALRTE